MPGNIKHTAGANPQPNNFDKKTPAKKFKLRQMYMKQLSKATKANLKTWEDRNRANKGTKLSK